MGSVDVTRAACARESAERPISRGFFLFPVCTTDGRCDIAVEIKYAQTDFSELRETNDADSGIFEPKSVAEEPFRRLIVSIPFSLTW